MTKIIVRPWAWAVYCVACISIGAALVWCALPTG